MMIDQKGFEANLSVIKTKDQMMGAILDIIA
jgi:flagellar hook protein FlgE